MKFPLVEVIDGKVRYIKASTLFLDVSSTLSQFEHPEYNNQTR